MTIDSGEIALSSWEEEEAERKVMINLREIEQHIKQHAYPGSCDLCDDVLALVALVRDARNLINRAAPRSDTAARLMDAWLAQVQDTEPKP